MSVSNRLKMHITEDNMLLDYPRACFYCDMPADIAIFERLPGIIEGVTLSIRLSEYKCIDHLKYEDMMIEAID